MEYNTVLNDLLSSNAYKDLTATLTTTTKINKIKEIANSESDKAITPFSDTFFDKCSDYNLGLVFEYNKDKTISEDSDPWSKSNISKFNFSGYSTISYVTADSNISERYFYDDNGRLCLKNKYEKDGFFGFNEDKCIENSTVKNKNIPFLHPVDSLSNLFISKMTLCSIFLMLTNGQGVFSADQVMDGQNVVGFVYVFKSEDGKYYSYTVKTKKIQYFWLALRSLSSSSETNGAGRFKVVFFKKSGGDNPNVQYIDVFDYFPIFLEENLTFSKEEDLKEKIGGVLLGVNSSEKQSVVEQLSEAGEIAYEETKLHPGAINRKNGDKYGWEIDSGSLNLEGTILKINDEKIFKIFKTKKLANTVFSLFRIQEETQNKNLIFNINIKISCNVAYLDSNNFWIIINPKKYELSKVEDINECLSGNLYSGKNNSWINKAKNYDYKSRNIIDNTHAQFMAALNDNERRTVDLYTNKALEISLNCINTSGTNNILKLKNEYKLVNSKIYDLDSYGDYFFKYDVKYETERREEPEDSSTGKSRSDLEKFISTWSCTLNPEKRETDKQLGYNIDRYYDVYSGMTPYVRLGFIDRNENTWNYIDSIYSPFIQSLSVKDNGVKTINVKLYDKDYASYTNMDKVLNKTINSTFDSDSRGKDKIYSLEDLLRKALRGKVGDYIATAQKKGKNEVYENDDKQLIDDFLKIEEDSTQLSANLKLRFGYCDYNQPLNTIDDANRLNKNSDDYATNYFKSKGSGKRNNRWWDFTGNENKDRLYSIDFNDKYIEGGKEGTIKTGGRKREEQKSKTEIERQKQINETVDQTTVMSQEMRFLITGFKTTLQNNGIVYDITAIEQKDCEIIGSRFLQRFATIKSFPNDVLYMLMHIFNETTNGENVTTSNIKILLGVDEEYKRKMGCQLVEKIDTKKLANNEEISSKFNSDYLDTYNIQNQNEVDSEMLEQISLSFGTEASFSNFSEANNKPPLYKSVSSLISEFCAACPPKKKITVKPTIYNRNGEEVNIYDKNAVSAPLSYYTVQLDGITYVVLYYRETQKPGIIRIYNWGVETPYRHCITNLSIENSNEFAILSGVNCFDASKGQIKRRVATVKGSADVNNKNSSSTESGVMVNQITYTQNSADTYEAAYSSSMYNGTIEILGDPFYLFDDYMQPCTYPIYLRVLVPMNEAAFVANDKDAEEWRNSKNIVAGGNQRLHELSGFYVVKEINHELSASGFKTTLSVMSYPNIQDDVLIGDSLKMV